MEEKILTIQNDNRQRFISCNKDYFIEAYGEIKSGDWFKSKFRSDHKFFHFVQVGYVLENGFICYETGHLYPKDDVECKVEIDFERWYAELLNKVKSKNSPSN